MRVERTTKQKNESEYLSDEYLSDFFVRGQSEEATVRRINGNDNLVSDSTLLLQKQRELVI